MTQERTLYNDGASQGLVIGALLSAMFLLQASGTHWWPGILIGDVIMLAIPFVAYRMMRKGYMANHRADTFSAVWLHGIIIFLCGSLIMATVCYIYTRFVDTGFIAEQTREIAAAWGRIDNDNARTLASELERLGQSHMLPTPIQFAISMLWTSSFFGSILSMILGIIIKLRFRRGQK